MADMNSVYCPKCRCHTNLIHRAGYRKPLGKDAYLYFSVEECNNCEQHFLTIRVDEQDGPVVKKYPDSLPSPVDELIPQDVKIDFEEALLCFSVGAYRGAAALARRTVQLICVDKGADSKKTLRDQIDQLLADGVITKDIQEWAHEVRFLGNDAAHPNKNTVSQDDAKDILDLLESLCEVLYVAPAKAAERKQKRTSAMEVQ